MNDKIVQNMLSALRSGDELYFLGDLAWRRYALDEFFDRWSKSIPLHWILGNHDKNWQPFRSKCASVSELKRISIGDNTVVLCHYPMLTWDKSHYNSWMLFGHHHSFSHGFKEIEEKTKGKMLNINVEFHNYMPYSEKEIIDIMSSKPDNWDLIKERTPI